MELASSGNPAAILLQMSCELNTPRILKCPSDVRIRATNFENFSTANVSYFIGLDSLSTTSQTILSGDRNVRGGRMTSNRVMIASSSSGIAFGGDLHKSCGNLGLGDGSAQQVSQIALRRQITAQEQSLTNNRVRWALP